MAWHHFAPRSLPQETASSVTSLPWPCPVSLMSYMYLCECTCKKGRSYARSHSFDSHVKWSSVLQCLLANIHINAPALLPGDDDQQCITLSWDHRTHKQKCTLEYSIFSKLTHTFTPNCFSYLHKFIEVYHCTSMIVAELILAQLSGPPPGKSWHNVKHRMAADRTERMLTTILAIEQQLQFYSQLDLSFNISTNVKILVILQTENRDFPSVNHIWIWYQIEAWELLSSFVQRSVQVFSIQNWKQYTLPRL